MSSMFEAQLDVTLLVKRLDYFGKVSEDLSDVMEVVAEHLHAAVSDEFATSGHGKWPPLKPSTLGQVVSHSNVRVGSNRHSKGLAAYYATRNAGGHELAARNAYRRAAGVKMKTRGDAFRAADQVGSERHNATRAAYYEAAARGASHEEATHEAMKVAQRGGILHKTGALAGSQHPEHGKDWAAVGTDKFYAVFHVSDAPRKIIPLRDFYDLPQSEYDGAMRIIEEMVAKKIGGSGFL
jgi:phage gpG-like protein